MPRPARRSRRVRLDSDERRAQLLSLGRAIFNARTYDEISIDDIARAAKISKGLLYHYFPSKRDFYVATLRAAAHDMLALVDPKPNELSRPPLETLSTAIDAYLRYVEDNALAYAWLLRAGVGVDREVSVICDETRRSIFDRILRRIPVDEPPPAVHVALRGWIGLVEAASLDWIERGRTMARDDLRELLVDTLPVVVGKAIEIGARTAR